MDIPFEFEGETYDAEDIEGVDSDIWLNLTDVLYHSSRLDISALEGMATWVSMKIHFYGDLRKSLLVRTPLPYRAEALYKEMVKPVRWWWMPARRNALKAEVKAMLEAELDPHYDVLAEQVMEKKRLFLAAMENAINTHPDVIATCRKREAERVATENRERLERARARAELNRAIQLHMRSVRKRSSGLRV